MLSLTHIQPQIPLARQNMRVDLRQQKNQKGRGRWKKQKWCMTEDKCSEARNRIFMKTHYVID